MLKRFLALSLVVSSSLLLADAASTPQETQVIPAEQPLDIGKISQAFGHMIAKSIAGQNPSQIGAGLDIAQVIQGLQDSAAGKTSPMTEAECAQAISAVQEKMFHAECKHNLDAADQFLVSKAKEEGVISLESGKVQYVIEKPGEGTPVENHFSPLVRFKGKFLDGKVFGESVEGEKISLDEVIPGLKSGLLGMKEGEKRTIFIHPDLAYGINSYLPPNSLLTFEIEVIQANAPAAQESDSVVPEKLTETPGELAGAETHVR